MGTTRKASTPAAGEADDDADPATKNLGLGLVGIGFVSFFISYALRAWLRFGPGRPTEEPRRR